ncbi:hypothetical protein B0F90DRAFT_1729045, partial [Multifurca ochricompacta]
MCTMLQLRLITSTLMTHNSSSIASPAIFASSSSPNSVMARQLPSLSGWRTSGSILAFFVIKAPFLLPPSLLRP